jgi:hypothetical protein
MSTNELQKILPSSSGKLTDKQYEIAVGLRCSNCTAKLDVIATRNQFRYCPSCGVVIDNDSPTTKAVIQRFEAQRCACGKTGRFWSALHERVFCSDACYEKEMEDERNRA